MTPKRRDVLDSHIPLLIAPKCFVIQHKILLRYRDVCNPPYVAYANHVVKIYKQHELCVKQTPKQMSKKYSEFVKYFNGEGHFPSGKAALFQTSDLFSLLRPKILRSNFHTLNCKRKYSAARFIRLLSIFAMHFITANVRIRALLITDPLQCRINRVSSHCM